MKKPGRPPQENSIRQHVQVRFDDKSRAELIEYCKSQNIPVGRFVREATKEKLASLKK